ncbi:MAG: TQO small subunit DoxD [Actinomycetota bacterium]|nr:TQO small subunit DoxD [Actinomycetota bacterium]
MTTPAGRVAASAEVGGESPTARVLIAVFRVGVALLWIENAGWKRPPDFTSLHKYVMNAVDYPVFPPFTWVIEHLVLPNFTFFGWMTLVLEASLGAFLLLGLATRLWAIVGIGQSLAITFSVLNAPHEWEWSYYLMILAHVALFATAAGRSFGLDGVLRPVWRASSGRVAPLLMRLS